MNITFDNEIPTIIGNRVILRVPTLEDVTNIIHFYLENKEHLEAFEPSRNSSFYTEAYWQADIKARTYDFAEGKSCRMFIYDKANPKEIIGTINLNQIVRGVFHACYLGYSIAEKYQGKGFMMESVALCIDFAFKELKLHRIMANYIPHNIRSGNLLKRLGFTVEGYARDYLRINGKWQDHILTSLTNKHWEPS